MLLKFYKNIFLINFFSFFVIKIWHGYCILSIEKKLKELVMYLTNYFTRPLTTLFDEFLDEAPAKRDFNPKANVTEDKDAYHIDIELPGVDKKDVSIEVKDNMLTVKGERKLEEKKNEGGYYRFESSYGKFERSWVVDEINTDKIKAEEKNGILKIELPKKEEVLKRNEVKQITVN
jgi:HSP20 family protein